MMSKVNYPIIHRKFVITSTYCMKDRSIRHQKNDFVKANMKLCKKVFDEIYKSFKYDKWWRHPISQQLEIKIRIKFGYSPATYCYDILNHFRWIYIEYLDWKKKRK